MNGDQLEDVLKNWLAEKNNINIVEDPYSVDDYYSDFIHDATYVLRKPTQMKANVVTVEVVDEQTGGEDVFPSAGGETYVILKVDTDGNVQYFKHSGWYRSWEGTTWNDGWIEVKQQEKIVSVWV